MNSIVEINQNVPNIATELVAQIEKMGCSNSVRHINGRTFQPLIGVNKNAGGSAKRANKAASRVAEIVNPVRLAYLTLEAPREGQASYTHVFEIIDGLRRRGFNVELYMPSYADRFELPNLVRRLLEHGRLQARLAMEWRGYDAVYVRGHNLAFPVAMLARVTGKPIVHEINGPHLDIAVTYPWIQPVHGLLSWMQRVQYRWADALVAVTPQLQRWLRLEGCTNSIEVIPNGANLAYFNPDLPKRVGLPARYVVFFGGFARWQGIATMLDAVRHPSWPSDVSLVIVGDGQMRPEVERAVLWTPRLQYLGRLPYREVGGVVAGAAAALVPRSERMIVMRPVYFRSNSSKLWRVACRRLFRIIQARLTSYEGDVVG